MARRKPKRRLRPKTPARVRKRKQRTRSRSHHRPELAGLGLAALGLLLASILYLGWNGGVVGGALRSWASAMPITVFGVSSSSACAKYRACCRFPAMSMIGPPRRVRYAMWPWFPKPCTKFDLHRGQRIRDTLFIIV